MLTNLKVWGIKPEHVIVSTCKYLTDVNAKIHALQWGKDLCKWLNEKIERTAMAVRNETKTVHETRQETVTRRVPVAKTVGVTYASDVSKRKLKVTKSQRSANSFVVTLENSGKKSIVIKKAQLADFLTQVQAFIA